MKKFLILLLSGLAPMLFAGTYTVLDSTVVINANGQVTTKTVFVQNDKHQFIKQDTYTLQNGQLKLSTATRSEYDVYGHCSLSETTSYFDDVATSGTRLIYEYDSQKLLWSKIYVYSQGEWELNQGSDYYYDKNDNVIKLIHSYNYDYGYTYDQMTTFAYDKGVRIADTIRSYNQEESIWNYPSKLHRYEYDSNGRDSITTELYYNSSLEMWEEKYKTVYAYDDDGRYVSRVDWRKLEDWEPYTMYNEHKNSNNGFIMYESYNYSNGNWIGSIKSEYTYNSDNTINSYIVYQFIEGTWAYQNKTEYDYSQSPLIILGRYFNFVNNWQISFLYYSYYHEEVSAIDTVSIDATFDVSKPAYDLQGRLVDVQSYHGIVIQDGHKFLR